MFTAKGIPIASEEEILIKSSINNNKINVVLNRAEEVQEKVEDSGKINLDCNQRFSSYIENFNGDNRISIRENFKLRNVKSNSSGETLLNQDEIKKQENRFDCETVIEKKQTFFSYQITNFCDICDSNRISRLIRLNGNERRFANAFLYKFRSVLTKNKIIYSTGILPQKTCERCFKKLYFFRNYIKKNHEANKKMSDHPPDNNQYQYNYDPLNILSAGDPINLDQPPFDPDQSYSNAGSSFDSCITQAQSGFNINNNSNSSNHYSIPELGNEYVSQFSISSSTTHSTSINYSNQTYSSESQSNPYEYPQYQSELINQQPIINQTVSQSYPATINELNSITMSQTDNQIESILSQPSTSTGIGGGSMNMEKHSSSVSCKGRKPNFFCNSCQKKFTHRGDYNKHTRIHTKEKPYNCRDCNRNFSNISNLKRHQRIHSGSKPYKCKYCGKSFNRSDKLENHKNSKSCKNKRDTE